MPVRKRKSTASAQARKAKPKRPKGPEVPYCEDCPFKPKNDRIQKKVVGTRGNPEADIVFVGESPGIEEVKQGYPFVGPSWELMASVLPKKYRGEKNIFITNAAKCSPRGKNKDEASFKNRATQCCHKRLLEEITAHPRRLIIALGNHAAQSLLQNPHIRITKDRGRLWPSQLAKLGVYTTVHPAFLLRGGGRYRLFKEDILHALAIYEKKRLDVIRTSIEPTFEVITDPEVAHEHIQFLRHQEITANDIETTGFERREDRILCVGVCATPNKVSIFPEETWPQLKELFGDESVEQIWHNGKFDAGFGLHNDLPIRVDHDTLLQSYTMDEVPGIHGLEDVAKDLLGAESFKGTTREYTKDSKGRKIGTFEDVPRPILYKRLAQDCSYTRQIHDIQRPRIAADPHAEREYTQTLLPASKFCMLMEDKGLYVDLEKVEENEIVLKGELDSIAKQINDLAGRPLNANSPKQVAELLFDDLGLRQIKGRSTDADVLEKLPRHPAVVALESWREKSKQLSTYVYGIANSVLANGRVYPTFLLHGSLTGRLACRNPNLMNIPRNALMRSMFAAPPGRRLIEIDLNQAELRSLATLSRDPALMEIYNSTDRSLHHEVATELFGENYDGDEKMRAKAVNFGIVYGRQAFSLAQEFEIPVSEAVRWIEGWFGRFPEGHQFIKKCRTAARYGRTITTTFGRRKRFGVVCMQRLHHLMNEAANFPHQSIASDITLHSGMAITLPEVYTMFDFLLEQYDAFVENFIHDALLIEAPDDDEVERVIVQNVTAIMSAIPPMWHLDVVPFKGEAKSGYAWGMLKDVA